MLVNNQKLNNNRNISNTNSNNTNPNPNTNTNNNITNNNTNISNGMLPSNFHNKDKQIILNGGKAPTNVKNTQPYAGGRPAILVEELKRGQGGGEEARSGEGGDARKETKEGRAELVLGALVGGDEKSEFHLWVALVLLLWSVCGLAAYSKVLKILWDSNDFE